MDTGRPCALLANWHATIVGPTGDAGLEQFVGNDVGDQLGTLSSSGANIGALGAKNLSPRWSGKR